MATPMQCISSVVTLHLIVIHLHSNYMKKLLPQVSQVVATMGSLFSKSMH